MGRRAPWWRIATTVAPWHKLRLRSMLRSVDAASVLSRFATALAIGMIAAAPLSDAAEPTFVPAPPTLSAEGYILMDGKSLRVITERNANAPLPPASLTKIMTSYVAAGEVAAGRASLTAMVPVSVQAWKTPGSRMFIREGTQVSLNELLKGIVIQSGNDASVAVAEFLAGSEESFADMMNHQAKALGMERTRFQNATGLPAEGHYSSATDLVKLALALIENYPDHYRLYSEKTFTYDGIEQHNRNRLLWRDRRVDGVKTGHTDEAGYCLVAAAEDDGMRLIAAVMGAKSDSVRVQEAQSLLSYGFRNFETHPLYEPGDKIKTSEIWYGAVDTVELGIQDVLYLTAPRGRFGDLQGAVDMPRVIEAPVSKGDRIGNVRVTLDGELMAEIPLVALEDVDASGWLTSLWHSVYLFFAGLVG